MTKYLMENLLDDCVKGVIMQAGICAQCANMSESLSCLRFTLHVLMITFVIPVQTCQEILVGCLCMVQHE